MIQKIKLTEFTETAEIKQAEPFSVKCELQIQDQKELFNIPWLSHGGFCMYCALDSCKV